MSQHSYNTCITDLFGHLDWQILGLRLYHIIVATMKNNLKSTIFRCPKCYPNISSTRASKIRVILMQHRQRTYSQRGLVVRAIVSEPNVPGSILDGGMDGF